jgi:hypothetical protein
MMNTDRLKTNERIKTEEGVSASGRVLEFSFGARSKTLVNVKDTGRKTTPPAPKYATRIHGKRFAALAALLVLTMMPSALATAHAHSEPVDPFDALNNVLHPYTGCTTQDEIIVAGSGFENPCLP